MPARRPAVVPANSVSESDKAQHQSTRCDKRIVDPPLDRQTGPINAPACATTPTDDVAYRVSDHATKLLCQDRKSVLKEGNPTPSM